METNAIFISNTQNNIRVPITTINNHNELDDSYNSSSCTYSSSGNTRKFKSKNPNDDLNESDNLNNSPVKKQKLNNYDYFGKCKVCKVCKF
jgi:hypothetical protein